MRDKNKKPAAVFRGGRDESESWPHEFLYSSNFSSCQRYFFLKDLKNPSLQRKLAAIRSYNHEIGLHSLGNCEVNKDMGITFHSGPTSNYWTGLKEIKKEKKQSPI